MEIHSVLRYNKNRTIKLETIEGNAFEALIGAIYLDGGFESARTSINKHVFRKYVNLNQILEEEIDFKSKLFIWSQKNRLPIDFEVLTEENNGSSWTYVVMVVINKQEYGRGTGTSKKKAEQAAASKDGAGGGNVALDELRHKEEMNARAKEKKLEATRLVQHMMTADKREEMKHQAKLRHEMAVAYKTGDEETRKRLEKRLKPEEKLG